MKIFMTGATGYIGSYVKAMLLDKGETVHALCRNPDDLEDHINLVKFKGDITDSDAVAAAMLGCEQVYHLAAYAKPWAKNPDTYYQINLRAVQNILDIAHRLGIQKTLFTSTAGVLGPSVSRPVKEDDERIGEIMNEYEDSKTQAEELCLQYVKEKNMDIVIVNPPRIYGPGVDQESNSITRMLKLYDAGKWRVIPGDGKGIGSYVHVEDVAAGHLLAMEHGRPGQRYILSGENLSYNEFFGIMKKITGKNYRLFHAPLPIMLLGGHLMVLREKITGTPPPITPKWIKKYSYNYALDASKAQNELGYTYRNFEEGLKQTYDRITDNEYGQ